MGYYQQIILYWSFLGQLSIVYGLFAVTLNRKRKHVRKRPLNKYHHWANASSMIEDDLPMLLRMRRNCLDWAWLPALPSLRRKALLGAWNTPIVVAEHLHLSPEIGLAPAVYPWSINSDATNATKLSKKWLLQDDVPWRFLSRVENTWNGFREGVGSVALEMRRGGGNRLDGKDGFAANNNFSREVKNHAIWSYLHTSNTYELFRVLAVRMSACPTTVI